MFTFDSKSKLFSCKLINFKELDYNEAEKIAEVSDPLRHYSPEVGHGHTLETITELKWNKNDEYFVRKQVVLSYGVEVTEEYDCIEEIEVEDTGFKQIDNDQFLGYIPAIMAELEEQAVTASLFD